MKKEQSIPIPSFWLPFAAWIAIFTLVSAAVTFIADYHMLWGEYPWTDPLAVPSWITDVRFIITVSINTAVYAALLLVALVPFVRRIPGPSAWPVQICSIAVTSIVIAHATSRIAHGLLVHFAMADPSSGKRRLFIAQNWWSTPKSIIVVEFTTALAVMIILTAALLLLRNWTHRFRYLAILGQWTSFALATTYGAWWSFDGAVNEGMSLGNPWYILSSTLLNVSDPWNYHHNGFIYAVHGLVFFTGYRLLLRRLTARRMLWLQSHCRVCGYDLTGITSVCPECGTALNPQIS